MWPTHRPPGSYDASGQLAGEVVLEHRADPGDHVVGGHLGHRRERKEVAGDDEPDDLAGDERYAHLRAVHHELREHGADDDRDETLVEQGRAVLAEHRADHRQQPYLDLRIVPRRQEGAKQPLPGAVRPLGDHGSQELAWVDGHLQRGEEEVVLAAEVVVHERGVDTGGGRDGADRRTPESLLGERRPRSRQDLGPGVRGSGTPAAGRARGGRGGRPGAHGVGTARCARANSSDSARSASRSARPAERRVLISSTTWPEKPRPARWRRNASAFITPRPGTRCSSLAEPVPSVRWMWRRLSPIRSAISMTSLRAMAAWERSIVVLA